MIDPTLQVPLPLSKRFHKFSQSFSYLISKFLAKIYKNLAFEI